MRYSILFSFLFSVFIIISGLNISDIKNDFPIQDVDCVSWNPYHYLGVEPDFNEEIPKSIIQSDLMVIKKHSSCIRTYFATANIEEAITEGKKLGLDFILGALVSKDKKTSEVEVNKAIALAKKHKNIISVLIGNENISKYVSKTFDGMKIDDILPYVRKAKQAISQPVSISELPHVWLKYPSLVEATDYIAVNLLPYWYSISANKSQNWMLKTLKELHERYPKKDIFVSETGWPTIGSNLHDAKTGFYQQRLFISKINATFSDLDYVSRNKIGLRYNLIEAFDQPWKSKLYEGKVGSHWGIYRGNGTSKYSLTQRNQRNWMVGIICVLCFILVVFIQFKFQYKNITSIVLSALSVYSSMYVLLITTFNAIDNYEVYTYVSTLFYMVAIIPIFISLIYAKECIEIFEIHHNEEIPNKPKSSDQKPQMVSIHLACSNEPAEMVIQSIQSLLDLDYPNFEIIVVDNNTENEDSIKALEDFTKNHPKIIKFYSLKNHSGFKAGALNYAIQKTHQDAMYIAIIDADYIVKANWLSDNIPLFDQKNVCAVQSPQNYKKTSSLFNQAVTGEYQGFFSIGMKIRNKKNALIMHGTLVILKADTLKSIQWNEGSICEDADLGLKLLKQGKKIIYNQNNYGYGVIPATPYSYMKQRFRWVYGGLRILYGSFFEIIGLKKSKLTKAARYHFIAGWLPWLLESFFILFSLIVVYIALNMLQNHRMTPSTSLLYPIFYLLAMRGMVTVLAYSSILKKNVLSILLAFIAGSSLTFSISLAAFYSLFFSKFAFERTSKIRAKKIPSLSFHKNKIANALVYAKVDIWLSFVFISLSMLMVFKYGLSDMDLSLWIVCLVVLSIPGLSHFILLLMYLNQKKEPNVER